MPKRLIATRRGNSLVIAILTVLGTVAALINNADRIGTAVFLALTSVEAAVFCAIYGWRSDWRTFDAARALVWVMVSYAVLSAHAFTLLIWQARYWWTQPVRELMYMIMAAAMLNLLLTMMRLMPKRGEDP